MDLLDRLLGHDCYATRILLDIVEQLDDEQLDQDFDVGHRTLRRTLEHLIWNIECWTDLMRGTEVQQRGVPPASLAELTTRHTVASAELMQFAREVVEQNKLDETFIDSLDDPPTEKTLGGAICHIATHGMHHRAQLLLMLRLAGVKHLPEGDVLSWERQLPDVVEPAAALEHKLPHPFGLDINPSKADVAFLENQLDVFNAQETGRDDFQPLNIVIRDEAAVIAGIKAVTGWDWLYIQVLWVAEHHRRSGLGTRLLHAAEDQARQRGCIGSCLSSFNFQAPEFYRAYGYSDFGRIDHYPGNNTMFFFSKQLD